LATTHPSASRCAGGTCKRCRSANAALGDTAWSDSRWAAIDVQPEADDHGGFDVAFLVKAGAVVAAVFFAVRWWL